jgi:mono/diheme cytochrome c family protein/plastocyanin
MNTSKQIIVMVALVFIAVIATGAYTMWDPSRADEAKDVQLEKTIRYGAWLFSQNCRVCHGDSGEGGSASNRLKLAPPLNRPDLQGKDATSGEVSQTQKNQQFKFIVNTITCGRVGKAMPTWGQSQGGTLNDEQIRQLATLISEGTGWDLAKEYAIEGVPAFAKHGDNGDHITLSGALDASSTTVALSSVSVLGKGDRIQADDEIMVVTAVDAANNTVEVERGVGTTSPKEHADGLLLLKVPVPPDPPAITQPACGQNLPAAVPTPGEVAPSTTLSIIAQGTAWSTDTLSAIAGQPLTLTVDNKDSGIAHNIVIFQGEDETGDRLAETPIEPGPVTQTLNFGPLDPGSYYYHCDVHPQMSGTLTASEAGAAPAGGAAPAAGTTPGAEAPAANPTAGTDSTTEAGAANTGNPAETPTATP